MDQALATVTNLAVLVFVVTCMAAAGLGLSVAAVAAPLRRGRFVALAVLANFIIAPAIAWGITRAVTLRPPFEAGLLLLGGAAGAPFLPKLVEAAGGDLARSVAL